MTVPPNPVSIQEPMAQRFVLDNGIRVWINELPHTRSVALVVYVGIGARYEEEALGGVSHFVEHMLFKGTTKRPTAQDIAVAIEGIGGFFDAATGQELTSYWIKVAYQHFDTGLEVLSDILQSSLLAPEEMEKERRVIVEEIRETFDAPDDLAFFNLNQLMWMPHPLGRDVAGTPATVGSLSRAHLRDHIARHYHANNLVVSVAGFVDTAAVLEKISTTLGRIPAAPVPTYLRFGNGQHAPRLNVHYKKVEQAHVAVTTWAYPREHPDRYAVSVLNTILGDGMSSRLFQKIREERGLAYSVSSFGNAFDDCGYFGSYAAVAPKNAALTLEAILHEWVRLRDEPIPDEELSKAKELIKGGLLLSMEDTSSFASWYGRQEALKQEILTVDQVTAGIDAVTLEDLKRVARDIFRAEWLNLSCVGPLKSDAPFTRVLKL